jgi:hypothetical protein
VGAVPGDRLAEKIIADLLSDYNIKTYAVPEHTELITHRKGSTEFFFLLNHSDAEQTFPLEGIKGVDLLSGKTCDNTFTVNGNDVAVIKT